MHKEMVVTATSGATSAAGVVSSWWLWLTDQNAAHLVATLTVLLIASQLFWGWRKFFRGEPK